MNEAEWLACRNPHAMLAWVRRLADGRRWRLFNTACCRRVESLLNDSGRQALDTLEAYADGRVSGAVRVSAEKIASEVATAAAELAYSLRDASRPPRNPRWRWRWPPIASWRNRVYKREVLAAAGQARAALAVADCGRLNGEACWESWVASRYTRFWHDPLGRKEAQSAHWTERQTRCDLLRDIFGNPFRPVALGPAGPTPTVVSLAQAAYNERIMPSGHLDPGRLAVLSDALEEADCPEQAILDHLRGPGPHVHGCWAVDLVRAKE
jgi:hypothetical protein